MCPGWLPVALDGGALSPPVERPGRQLHRRSVFAGRLHRRRRRGLHRLDHPLHPARRLLAFGAGAPDRPHPRRWRNRNRAGRLRRLGVDGAPAGTYITGGSTFSRLATESGQHGYLAVSPDSGASLSYENQNDDQGHESGIPAGNWRFLVARLECTQPNEGNRCVGAAGGAHTYVKQVRIQLTDVVSPTISIGGSMFSGAELRGPQTISVSAADQGAGLQSIQVVVNGQGATGDDLSGSCNPLPGNMTSRLSPCPPSFGKTYTLDTAKAPFQEGVNSISVCAYDYAQTGTPNSACESKEVLVNNLCPGSTVGGGNTITAGFAGNHKGERTLAFRRRALIRGRLRDPARQPGRQRPGLPPGPHRSARPPFPPDRHRDDERKRRLDVQAAPGPVAVLPGRLPLRRVPDLHRPDPPHADPGDAPPEPPPHPRPQTDLLLRGDRRA